MRRANVALVLIGTFFSVMVSLGVMVSPSKTASERTATNNQVNYGLHVALPLHMKNFPVELVPLP